MTPKLSPIIRDTKRSLSSGDQNTYDKSLRHFALDTTDSNSVRQLVLDNTHYKTLRHLGLDTCPWGNASSYRRVSLSPLQCLAYGLTRKLSCTTIDEVSSLTRLCVGKERPTQYNILLRKKRTAVGSHGLR